MLQEYAYLWGSLLLGVVWCIFFFLRKDLRKEIIITSFVFSLLGFGEIAFSEYWSPPTLFNLIPRAGFSIEDTLFMFFVGGITSSLFEIILYKKNVTMREKKKRHYGIISGFLILTISLLIEHLYPLRTIYSICVLAIMFGATILFRRKDLIYEALISGVLFTGIYSLLFLGLFQHVDFYHIYYHTENLSGIIIWGNPIEEYLFGFANGFLGSVLYKFFFDKKII